MNQDEAWEYVQSGGVVTSGGYTYYKDGYFACGTYPGCVRGGLINYESFEGKTWYPQTEENIVCKIGYRPCQFLKGVDLKTPCDWLNRLNDYLEERLTVKAYKNPDLNAKICRQFFNKLYGYEAYFR